MAPIEVKFITVTGTIAIMPGQMADDPALVTGASLANRIAGCRRFINPAVIKSINVIGLMMR
jgi:hypothetical protein